MRIGILLGSMQKGFLVSLATELQKKYDVRLIATDEKFEYFINKKFPEKKEICYVLPVEGNILSRIDVVHECKVREEKYGMTFASLIAQDRGLGKGYIGNVHWHPDRGDVWWSKERKLATLLDRVMACEKFCEDYQPDVVLGVFYIQHFGMVLESFGCKYLNLAPAKYHSWHLWSDNPFITSQEFIDKINIYVEEPEAQESADVIQYVQNAISKAVFSKIKHTHLSSLKKAARIAINEMNVLLRGFRKEYSYAFMGWLWPTLRHPGEFKFMMKHGVRPEDLKGNRIIYFPLHFEPEVALMSLSPELNNSYEVISWLSKSAPADAMVVVKEQPEMFGMRSRWYYNLFRRMANVVLARPDTTSWDWIRNCDVVSTITGTAATEGVYFEKPVLSFSRHAIVNHLPSVRYAGNFLETKLALTELFALNDKKVLLISKSALHRAQREVSFDLPGFEKYWRSDEVVPELAGIAVKELYAHYPDIFCS